MASPATSRNECVLIVPRQKISPRGTAWRCLDYCLCDTDILEAIEYANHDGVFITGRRYLFSRRQRWERNRQVVTFDLVIGNLSYRLGGLPVIGIDGVFSATDWREAVHGAKR